MDRNKRFLEKIIIVTGGAAGIGNGAAAAFAREGGSVVIADIDAATASLAANNIVAAGGTAIAVPTDVRSSAAVEHLVQVAVATFGGVDVLSTAPVSISTAPSIPFRKKTGTANSV